MRRAAAIGFCVFAACTPPEIPLARIPPVSTGKVRVRVFTEPSPVKSVTTVGRFVFVATDSQVERWDGASVTPLTTTEGDQIIALASDEDRGRVWIVTDGGIGFYDTTSETYRDAVILPFDLGSIVRNGATLAPASDDGVWLGTASGVVHVGIDGAWTPTAIKSPVTALERDRAGWLWVATPDGLVARKPNGDIE